ncbi:MAG: hypothetical protein JWN48_1324 [Myxococcaceae bacterium]|nr:hypothetical protein [Myxococcaceae bacterium]
MAAKGYDDSPPRNGVIFFYTVLTVVFLYGVQQLLNSYFAKMMDNELQTKVFTVGLDKAVAAKARDKEVLEKSGIEAAMRLYAQRGRSASAIIQNESGAGKPAIAGWSQLKREPATGTTPAPATPAAVPVMGAAPTDAPPQGLPAGSGGQEAPRGTGNTSPSQPGAKTPVTNNRGTQPSAPITPGMKN